MCQFELLRGERTTTAIDHHSAMLYKTEEQAAKRAAQKMRLATLPEHLRLGVTLAGMRELLLKLPRATRWSRSTPRFPGRPEKWGV